MINLLHGDCLQQMKTLDDNSVDSIVSDPPYGISFMAKKWDYDVPSVEVWTEAMRVLKPGGHALIACGTRTQHRMVVNIEDAGFEIRDVVSWIYGSGFPKSLSISKSIDKQAGVEREVVAERKGKGRSGGILGKETESRPPITAPATDAAKQWDGWGTALKPSSEFFTLCRKPLSERTIAANVLKWGTGGINIDGCRVGDAVNTKRPCGKALLGTFEGQEGKVSGRDDVGRFPANLIHDGSQEVLELFPETKPSKSGGKTSRTGNGAKYGMGTTDRTGHDDQGSAARFFYCPKASKRDRNDGCEELEDKVLAMSNQAKAELARGNMHDGKSGVNTAKIRKNNHPTVKPTALMAYLCRLITPTGGVVLDPYMGSGSTGKAAVREGFSFIGIELDSDYYEICKARVTV